MSKIKILPSGKILIRRTDNTSNINVLNTLKEVLDEKSFKDLKNFFENSKETEIIFGEQVFCGWFMHNYIPFKATFTITGVAIFIG